MQLSRHRTHAKTTTTEDSRSAPRLRRGLASLRAAPAGKAIAISGALIAIGVAPVALASGWSSGSEARSAGFGGRSSLRGGIHNPPHSSFSRTTGLFANTNGWVMRMKNLGGGGGATLLCGAPAGGSACLEASNRSSGFAFQFASDGSTGGTILLKNASGAPFTTNAHGVASGLNANYLEGKQASEFQLASKPAAKAEDAEKLGGQPASAYAMGQLLFADVSAEGKVVSTRGASTISKSGTTYTLTFGATDVSRCSYTASPLGKALSEGQIGVAPVSGKASEVEVSLPAKDEAGFDLQVIC